MESAFSQIGPWIFLLTLGSGMGIPLGIPPAPDDQVMTRLAPPECVFYTTWAGVAPADPRSKNQAEQMLAEPEVRQFIEHLEKWIRQAVKQAELEHERDRLSAATVDIALLIARHQTVMYLSDVAVRGNRVSVKGGMVVALGADAPAARKLFHEHARSFFLNLNAERMEAATIAGEKWYRVKMKAEFPTLLVGIKDSYLIVSLGDSTPDAIFRLMEGPAPPWLVEARRHAAFERPTGLTYINLRRLREAGAGGGDPLRKQWLDLLGLTQSPWVLSASGLQGEDVVTRTVLPIEGEPRGLLSPVKGRGLAPADLAAIPRDATVALAVRFDLQKLLDTILDDAARVGPEVKVMAQRLLDHFQREGEKKPRRDVFACLGDRWCFYNSPSEGTLVLTGLTAVVPITDRTQFSRNYEVYKRLIAQNIGMDLTSGPGGQRLRRFRFAGGDLHYVEFGEFGLAPAWWAGEKELVAALSPQNVKAYLSRPAGTKSLADVPEIAAELARGESLLAVGYLDAPRVYESVYPLLVLAAPSYLGAVGLSEGRRDISMIPSLPSVRRHLRPGVATLRRTDSGLEMLSRGSMPGFGLAGPALFLAWDSEWLNLVFGEAEDNAPPPPAPARPPR